MPNPIHSRARSRILLLLSLLLTPPLLAANQKPATRPATQPTAADNPDPDFQKGRARARQDLQANTLGELLPIPETFLLQWHPGSPDANLVEYYQAVAFDKYGVKVGTVMFNAASPDRRMFALGYNQEMSSRLEKRCGAGALDALWKRACNTPSAKRAQYLKHRPPKPATRPSKPTP
jgi:hypothetical protein